MHIYNETRRSKMPFINVLILVAENMIAIGKSQLAKKKMMKRGKRAKFMENVGDHLAIPGNSRKSCERCATFTEITYNANYVSII